LTSGTRIKYNDNHYPGEIVFTDSSFFDVFGFPFKIGSAKTSFGPGKAILSEKMASNIFGTINPVGETIIMGISEEYTVSGIIENVPTNSSLQFDVLVPHNDKLAKSESCSDDVCIYPKLVFIKTQQGAEYFQLNTESKARGILTEKFPVYFALQPLDDLYLHDRYDVRGLEKGNLKLVRIFMAIGLIILTLAILNYVNLSLSKIVSRYKEIGLKKVVGASKISLTRQILFESIILTAISFLFAILLTEVVSPFLESLYGKAIPFISYFDFPEVLFFVATPVIVGVIAGLYPSLVFARFSPRRILSGLKVNKSGKNPFMYYLTVFQFSAAIILISYTIIMFLQIDFVKHKDLGFEEDHLLKINLYGPARKKFEVLSNSFLNYPGIQGVTVSQGVPGEIGYSNTSNDTDGKSVQQINIDPNFLDVFEIELLEGRQLLPGDTGKVAYVNETVMNVLSWDSIQGRKYQGKEIIGIVNDFHTGSMYNNFDPIFLVCYDIVAPNHMTVKLRGDQLKETMDFINGKWKEVSPDFPMFYEFYDDYFDSMYKSEERLSKLMSTFSILAIIISCLGIIGMVEFTAVNKTKEIGIRKTLGARTMDIIRLMAKSYLVILGISVLIAIPIAWKVASMWLQSFAFRVELYWYHFVLAGGAIAIIALFTISYQTLKAARRNPVESLRYE
jgi:putative ABC transport system permease protein